MPELTCEFQYFNTSQDRTNNLLEFFTFDLKDVNLGIIMVAIQTSMATGIFQITKEIIRDAIDDFAAQAKPLTASDNLEKLLSRINNQTKTKLNTADYGKIQAAFVYIKNNEMHFSIHNDFKIILIRKSRIFDIIKMTYGIPPRDYDKFFSRIYSGDLKANDHILITTAESWECYDTNKLPDVLNKLSLKSAAEFLKNYLPEINPYKLGGALGLIKSEASPEKPIKSTLTPSESIKELLDTEESTTQWLSPTPWQRFKKTSKYLNNLKQKILATKNKKNIKQTSTTSFAKSLLKLLTGVLFLIRTILAGFKKISKLLPKKLIKTTNLAQINRPKYKTPQHIEKKEIKKIKKSRENFLKTWSKTIAYFTNRSIRSFSSLPKSTKLLFLTATCLIIAFGSSIYFVKKNNQQNQIVSNFEQSIDEIKTLHTQANQATIFKDFSRARTLLIQANQAINELPVKNKKNEEIKSSLLEENKQQLNRANRLTLIPLPLELADLNNLFKSPPDYIEFAQGKLIIASQNQLVMLDPQSSEVQTVALPADVSNITQIVNEGNAGENSNLLILHDNTNITRFVPNDRTYNNINNTFDISGEKIADATIFNDRLYLLDTVNNQIWRHLKARGNFQAGQAWLSVPSNLSQAQALAIDGLIYLLDNSSGLIQLNRGVRTDWQAENIEPDILKASKLRTTEDSDFLYLLDPTNQRLVVFDKDGSFIQQLTSPGFDNLQDFEIIESNKNISAYLLNGSKIYVIQFKLEL